MFVSFFLFFVLEKLLSCFYSLFVLVLLLLSVFQTEKPFGVLVEFMVPCIKMLLASLVW
uniref:Uncharacterized protein n=1 Tax=Rhizophora mucronata TaxID=61149 RepID=A0A2P2LS96_RHIMU